MAKWLNLFSIAIGSVGIFLGFYFLDSAVSLSLRIVTISTVGIVGLLAFVRHVIFHRSDAKRLGWETDRPDWMFEVGFANLAFSVMGFLSCLPGWTTPSQALVLFGYAVYLVQASALHGYRYMTDAEKSPARLWRSCIATLIYAVAMTVFAVMGIGAK